jgi:hypothetical protein
VSPFLSFFASNGCLIRIAKRGSSQSLTGHF